MAIDLGLRLKETPFQDTEKDLLQLFYSNGTGKENKGFRFARLDSNFPRFLPYLNDGAVKLYLYYLSAAKNETGESWHSVDTISQKLDVTARSIGNWNHQLEDLGLIYRTSNRRKSKATFVLPLTGFAVKMSIQKMEQILVDLKLRESSRYEKVFGRFQSATKLYWGDQGTQSLSELVCLHLKKDFTADSGVINSIDIYLFHVHNDPREDVREKLSSYEGKETVVLVEGEDLLTIGSQEFTLFNCFWVNTPPKTDAGEVYNIMKQLTGENVDFSDLNQISLRDTGGEDD